jgi:hypothetical protein
MHASFSISRLIAFVALLFVLGGVSASPVPAPLPLDDAAEDAAELVERSAMHTGGEGTYFYPGLGACGWVRVVLSFTHLHLCPRMMAFH